LLKKIRGGGKRRKQSQKEDGMLRAHKNSQMKKVIIIGATSGIGRELVKLFVQDDCVVGATGRRQELLDSLKNEFPGKIFTACFDVTGSENIHHLQSLIDQLGGMDIFIYNSGFGHPSKTLEWAIDRQTTLTNVNGFVETVNYAFNYFAQQGRGQIAAISSIASNRGNSWAPAYSASKAYMSVYMEGLHMKAAKMKLDIALTDIQPGFVNTKMAKGNGQFWVAPVDKAVRQIFAAIKHKKRRAYITKRWWLIAWIMRWMPYWIYGRIG
jgi:short-subunit dehydrogenase